MNGMQKTRITRLRTYMIRFVICSESLCALVAVSAWLAPCVAADARTEDLLWGDLVITAGGDSLLGKSYETEAILTRLFAQDQPSAMSGSARGAMLTLNHLVVMGVVTLADGRSSELHVPLTTGEQVNVYLDDIVLGGTVIAFSPLTRSVLTSVPIFGVRRLRLSTAPTTDRIQAEALEAGKEFARIARARGLSIGSRVVQAAVRKGLTGAVTIDAGRKLGLVIGSTVNVASDGESPVECEATDIGAEESSLKCTGHPAANGIGVFLRPLGGRESRYQVLGVSIESAKARELIGDSDTTRAMLAFAASDTLATHGATVLPPVGIYGERLTSEGVRRFVSHYGFSDSEVETFSIKFPPPEVQITVRVDGYNSAIVDESKIRRVRVHKAWATVVDNLGRRAEGIGVEVIDEVPDWETSSPQSVDAREAIRKAVCCASSRLVGEAGESCAP